MRQLRLQRLEHAAFEARQCPLKAGAAIDRSDG
jgi:hypothetical protein